MLCCLGIPRSAKYAKYFNFSSQLSKMLQYPPKILHCGLHEIDDLCVFTLLIIIIVLILHVYVVSRL